MKPILATSAFCGPCKMVKEYIQKNNIDIEIKSMEDDLAFFKEQNIKSVPILVTDRIHYSGAERIIKYFKDNQSVNN
jgi:glutaredoxin